MTTAAAAVATIVATATDPISVGAALSRLQALHERNMRRTREYGGIIRPRFDAVAAAVPCEVHPDCPLEGDWEKTLWESWRHDEFRLVRVQCPACQWAEAASSRRRYWARRGVPDRVLDATFATFRAEGTAAPQKREAMAKAKAFAAHAGSPINPLADTSTRHGGFLLLVGTTGTGKGHLAVAVMKELSEGGLFTTHADLLTDLRASYRTGEAARYLERLKSAPCLILDEFGLAASGADEAPVLYQVTF